MSRRHGPGDADSAAGCVGQDAWGRDRDQLGQRQRAQAMQLDQVPGKVQGQRNSTNMKMRIPAPKARLGQLECAAAIQLVPVLCLAQEWKHEDWVACAGEVEMCTCREG
eukprot:1160166-Pelagomonas_calceolata.AAC.7